MAGNQGFSFIGTAAYGGIAGQMRYATGDGASDFHVQLTGTVVLVAADFGL